MTKFKIGDKVRILDAMQIEDAIEWGFKSGEIYDVVEIDADNDLVIKNGEVLLPLLEDELQYIEKVEGVL